MLFVQWAGDFHFSEMMTQNRLPDFNALLRPNAPYLVVTGDNFYTPSVFVEPFLEYCARNWEKVFIVMGNQEYEIPHEFGRISVPQYGAILDEIVSMEEHENIMKTTMEHINTRIGDEVLIWLTNTHYDIPDTNIRMAGVCLWADDYKPALFVNGVLAGKRERKSLQEAEHTFLKRTISKCKEDGKTLVIASHFMPSNRIPASLYGQYKSMSPEVYPFAGFCVPKEEMFTFPLLAWICGHVHHEMTFKIAGMPLYVNYTNTIVI